MLSLIVVWQFRFSATLTPKRSHVAYGHKMCKYDSSESW